MYIMSSGREELRKIIKTTIAQYSKNRIHILCVSKRFIDKFYVIWVSMIDLQKSLGRQNLSYLVRKKLKVTAIQSIRPKIKVNDIKEK